MQLLIDFFPPLAFLVSYLLGGIYVATATMMAACALQLGVDWVRKRAIKPLHWIMALLVFLFGTATLVLHDPRFIQMKPTVFMGLLAVSFLVSQWTRKPLAQRLLESVLPEVAARDAQVWRRLNLAWVAFFAFIGAVNLYVAREFSEQTWVYFAKIGISVLLLLFLFPQLLWLMPRESAADDSGSKQ
jgi:intracellular septation protein